MPTFRVYQTRTEKRAWSTVLVEADTAEEANAKSLEGQGQDDSDPDWVEVLYIKVHEDETTEVKRGK